MFDTIIIGQSCKHAWNGIAWTENEILYTGEKRAVNFSLAKILFVGLENLCSDTHFVWFPHMFTLFTGRGGYSWCHFRMQTIDKRLNGSVSLALLSVEMVPRPIFSRGHFFLV